jgi:hypothetical protein
MKKDKKKRKKKKKKKKKELYLVSHVNTKFARAIKTNS